MIFKLTKTQESELLDLPETGMGYQVVEASKQGYYPREKFLVLNSEVVIEMNASTSDNIRKVVNEGIMAFKESARVIVLNAMIVLNENQFRAMVSEPRSGNEGGAMDSPVENANGEELFVRLSAFDNDRRIDKVNMCLRAGSFTTTSKDYLQCKTTGDNPVERYALPNNDTIQFAFYIQPLKVDTLQKGTVQPANGKRGGGKEAFFANGTASGTFTLQTPY